MGRRSFAKPSDMGSNGDRPSLEKVLDIYGVDYSYKTSQMVRCPIHGDATTPSCSINLDKGLWNCHSCGEGGDAWTLIMKKEACDFDGARAFAAAHGLADGVSGGGGVQVRGRYDRGSGSLPARSRTNAGDRAYAPSWRRRRSDAGS